MSENQNRGTRDFSQYDSMETAELEQILRLDAEAPEGAEADTELILYVMEVLASRRNNTDITGNTAQQAWESFTQNYMPHNVHDFNHNKERKATAAPWVRRLIAAAAVIALVIIIPVSAKAFSFLGVWNVIANWAKETFSFISSEDTISHGVHADSEESFASLQDALMKSNRDPSVVPTWIPDGFALDIIKKDSTPAQEIYFAFYRSGNEKFQIQVQSYLDYNPEKVEVNDDLIEIYTVGGIDFYLFSNNKQLHAIWIIDSYECHIAGDLSTNELKLMIDSIEKG